MSSKIIGLNIIKIVLDIIMSVLFVLMFNKNVISLNFHEIGGLFVCILFLIHKLLNWKWIVTVSKRIFSNKLSFKLRFGYIITFLLLISVLLIIISGIFIFKTIFAGFFVSSINWKSIHYFSAACSLVLVGIHLGLNWGFVMGIFKKFIKIPTAIAKPISVILVIAIVSFGAYSVVTSSFTRWISSPFSTSQLKGGFNKPMDFPNNEFNNDTERSSSGQNSDGAGTLDFNNSDNSTKSSNNIPSSDEQNGEDGKSPNYGKDFNRGERPSGFHQKGSERSPDDRGFPDRGKHGGNSSVISVILTFISIIGLFSTITYYCGKLLNRRKRYIILH